VPGGKGERRVRRFLGSRHLGDLVQLVDHGRRLLKFARVQVRSDAHRESERQHRQRTGVPRELDLPGRERAVALLVPQGLRGVGGKERITQNFARGGVLAAERTHGPL
jgi:hypothetical protein